MAAVVSRVSLSWSRNRILEGNSEHGKQPTGKAAVPAWGMEKKGVSSALDSIDINKNLQHKPSVPKLDQGTTLTELNIVLMVVAAASTF